MALTSCLVSPFLRTGLKQKSNSHGCVLCTPHTEAVLWPQVRSDGTTALMLREAAVIFSQLQRRPFPFSVTRRAGNYWKLRWSHLLLSFSALSPLFLLVLLWANWTLQCHIFLLRNIAVLEAPFAFATSNMDTSSGFTEKLPLAVHLAWVKWRDKVFRIILPQVIMIGWMLFTFTWCYPIAPHTSSWWKIVYEQVPVWF